MFVAFLVCGVAILALLAALRSHLLDGRAVLERLAGHVVSALRHGVGLAVALIAHQATRDYPLLAEPAPRRTDLASVAAHRHA